MPDRTGILATVFLAVGLASAQTTKPTTQGDVPENIREYFREANAMRPLEVAAAQKQ
jgi:hypothetical protein